MTYFFVVLFLALMVYFSYFMFFRAESVINNSYNSRTDTYAQKVIRGSILSSDGTVLAESSVNADGDETRNYPYGKICAHVVGYTIQGKSGIESFANFYMLRSHAPIWEKLINDITGNKNEGDNVVTTIDIDVQEAAYTLAMAVAYLRALIPAK